jgi:hypothetical protein
MVYTQFISNEAFTSCENAAKGKMELSQGWETFPAAQRNFLHAGNTRQEQNGAFPSRETSSEP